MTTTEKLFRAWADGQPTFPEFFGSLQECQDWVNGDSRYLITPEPVHFAAANWDIHSPEYRPYNVTITQAPSSYKPGVKVWVVLDWNGTVDSTCDTFQDAKARQRRRQGVIKAALTRRANKVAGK